MPTDRPWPVVKWNLSDLDLVASAVRLLNPYVTYDSDEEASSYIRNASERELYRAGTPLPGFMIATGGWIVVFISDGTGGFKAFPAITGYTAKRYALSNKPA